jgi:beta-xylosidase
MNKIRTIINALLLLFLISSIQAQDNNYLKAGNGNPLIPGYFADPTIEKIGDTYYLYATTDGIMLASGEPQVWVSKDFVNWFNYELNLPIPNGMTNCWAPDLVKGPDGKYYYFNGNCEPGLCYIYGYKGDTPVGPFEVMNNGKAVIPAKIWGNYPALDAQYFLEGDTALYAYFGTWAENNGGLGCIKVSLDDYKTIVDKRLIPATELPGVFEGAYMMKKNKKYILMYSTGDCRLSSYRVRYSYGDSPMGPFTPGATNTNGESNTILETNTDGSIDSPGHHSVLQDGDNYYIVYHRHDNPHSGGGEFRQVCADSMIFLNDSTIKRVNATHTGIGYLSTSIIPENIAYQYQHSYIGLPSNCIGLRYTYYPENAPIIIMEQCGKPAHKVCHSRFASILDHKKIFSV